MTASVGTFDKFISETEGDSVESFRQAFHTAYSSIYVACPVTVTHTSVPSVTSVQWAKEDDGSDKGGG